MSSFLKLFSDLKYLLKNEVLKPISKYNDNPLDIYISEIDYSPSFFKIKRTGFNILAVIR